MQAITMGAILPPIMPEPQPPTIRKAYPGLAPNDVEVWTRWLTLHAHAIVRVYYDLALGGIVIDDPNQDEAMRNGWRYTTAVKVDVVVVTAEENLVCEIKPFARLGALGQALGYATLLDMEPLNDLPNIPTVIADDTSPEVRLVAAHHSVRLEIVRDTA